MIVDVAVAEVPPPPVIVMSGAEVYPEPLMLILILVTIAPFGAVELVVPA